MDRWTDEWIDEEFKYKHEVCQPKPKKKKAVM